MPAGGHPVALSFLVVFLLLIALYESWITPASVMLRAMDAMPDASGG
jgi:multidrug efflux pump subunit AcrB